MSEKHSAVCYIFREGTFSPVREAKPFHNDFGLDLFQYKGAVYEGRTGLQFCPLKQAEDIASVIGKHGGLEKVQKLIADSLERTGLSPRYTRPNEKKKDIFPPKEKDENRVFAKDLMGNKHYYYRFYNENGIELYTMEKKREFFQTVYVPCDGFMVGIDQRHRLEEILKWLSTLEHGIRGEIERVFNESMGDPKRWADLGFANLLGRYYEAKRHNIPLEAERRQREERWAIIMVVVTVVAPSALRETSTARSRRLALVTSWPFLPRYSISSAVRPAFRRPPRMAMVAGTAPLSRMICSTLRAVSTFWG